MPRISTRVDNTPITIPGVIPLYGNMKPVMLVRTVVIRKIAVNSGNHRPPIIPKITMNPVAIPIRLIITCS